MVVLIVAVQGADKWDSGFGQHGWSRQSWCYVPPSGKNSGSKCLLPLREFSTHLHPSPINCLVYLHLAVPAKWEFALKGINVSLFTSLISLPFSPSLCLAPAVFHSLLSLCLSFSRFFSLLCLSLHFSLLPFAPSIPSSLPLSPLLRNTEMKIIGEVSKMQIVWVSQLSQHMLFEVSRFPFSFSFFVVFPALCTRQKIQALELVWIISKEVF